MESLEGALSFTSALETSFVSGGAITLNAVTNLTADAATIAKKAKAKKLILTHFSQRYKDTNELQKEAEKIFKNTECAHDFLTVQV